jgi:transposase
MAKGYRPVGRDQQFLLPPDMREWLPATDPVWLVIEVIGQCDMSGFHAGRRTGGPGRAGYDPDMLVTLLVWAWLQGVHSSRQIERLCGRDVAFRVICAGDVPDHATIARFRQGFAAGVEQLFEQVLLLCQRLGLGQLGVVALDGTKIASPASPGQNRTAEGLAKAAAAERARQAARDAGRAHAETDAAEDARFGDRRGDEMPDDRSEDDADGPAGPAGGGRFGGGPGESRPGRSRSARIAEALADLAGQAGQEQAERDAEAAERQARQAASGDRPVDGRPPAGQEIVLAEQALATARAAAAARVEAWQRTSRGPRPPEVEAHHRVRRALARLVRAHQIVAARTARRARRPGGPVRNITDPQSRLQPLAGGGWLQGYNAQALTTSDGVVLAAKVSNSPSDRAAFKPMMQAAVAMADRVGAGPIGLILADAGYLSVDNLTAAGPDRLIAVGNRRTVEAAARARTPSEDSGGGEATVQAMRARLATPEGITAYRQRGRIAETTFGHAKHNLNFRRFTGIGLDRAQAEWTFHAAVHNLSKIISLGRAPAWQIG